MSFKIGDEVLVANLDIKSSKIIEERLCYFTQRPIWWVEIELLNREKPFYGAFFKDTLFNIGNIHFYLKSIN